MKSIIITQGKIASGAEVVTSILYKEKRDETIVITGSKVQADFYKKRGFKVIDNPGIIPLERSDFKFRKVLRVLRGLVPLRSMIKKHSPNYIHVYNIPSLLYSTLASVGLNVPIVLHVHDYYSKDKLVRIIAKFIKWKPKSIIAVSNSIERDLISLGFSRNKLCFLHNGLETEPFPKTNEGEVKNKTVKVGFVGSIAPWKGLHILLKAATLIKTKNIDIEFEIIGPILDDKYKVYIEELTKKVKYKVRFLGLREDVKDIMKSLDILVHCSIERDPFPTVIIEGMHYGCAVIASNLGGASEVIKDGQTGLIHESGSVEDLARKISALIEDKTLRETIIKNSIKFSKENLSANVYRSKFFNIVENSIS